MIYLFIDFQIPGWRSFQTTLINHIWVTGRIYHGFVVSNHKTIINSSVIQIWSVLLF